MRRTLLGCCQDCCHYQTENHDCNDRGYPFTCKGCSMFTKPKVIGSSKDELSKPKGPMVTCQCLLNATRAELKNHTCKYWRPVQ